MSDSESPSPSRRHEGFERRWIKDPNYTGPERRRGGDRRRQPATEETAPDPEQTELQDASKELPATPKPPGKFKPFRP